MALAPEPPQGLAPLQQTLRLPYPLLADPGQTVFADYGLLGKNGATGGNFIIGKDGTVHYAYRGATPDDRPALAELLAAAKAAAGGGVDDR